MDSGSAPFPVKRKGSKTDLPTMPSSSKKAKMSPSSSPVPSGSGSSPSSSPPPIPSLDEKPHSETDVRILQHQNRHLYFHLREKDRRIQEGERREREWEGQCSRWQQQLSLLLSSWDEVVHDVQLCTRRIGADEVPPPPLPQGRRKPRNAVLRLLASPPSSSAAEGKVGEDDPMDSDGESGSDPSSTSDGADEDELAQVDQLLHSRVSYAHDLVSSLTSHLLTLREENASLRAMAKGEAKEGSDVYLLWEKNEELTKKVEEMSQAVAVTMKEGKEVRLRAERLHHEVVFAEEQRRLLEAERQRCEVEWMKTQRKVDKLDKEREMWMKMQKEGQLKATKAEAEQPQQPSSSSTSSSSSPLHFDDLVDRSSLESLEEEKRELQQRLMEAAAKAEKRAAELGKMRTELHRKEVELAKVLCEGVAEEGVKESLTYKLLATELQTKRDECEMARLQLAKYARELQEKEATQANQKEGQQREMERLLKAFQEKEAQMVAEVDRLSKAQTRAERDREEALARYDALADRPAEERKKEEEERRRLLEGMERTIQQQDVELRAMREQLQQTQELSVHKWIVKAIKLQRRVEERDAQLQLLAQQMAATATAPTSLSDSASIASLQAQVASLQQQLAALTSDPELVTTLTDTNTALMSELDDLATAHSELSEQHSRLQASFVELQRDRSALYSEKLKFKTMETLVRAKCSAHEQTIAALKGEALSLAESNRALDAWKGAMEDSGRRFDALKAAMERRVMDAQAVIASTRAELAKVKEERMAQAKAYKERGKLLEERELKLQELDKKYQNAKEYYTTVLSQLRALQEKQAQAKAQAGHLQGQQLQAGGGAGGGGEGLGGAQSDAELELSLLKRRMKCGVCSQNDKSVVIAKCWHLFCFDCIDANINARHRKCPACGIKFDRPDVHTVYGLQG